MQEWPCGTPEQILARCVPVSPVIFRESNSGRTDSTVDDLHRYHAIEAAAVAAYERHRAAARGGCPPQIGIVLASHQRRLASIEALLARYEHHPDTTAYDGPFASLLERWEVLPEVVTALADSEREMLGLYVRESKQGPAFIASLITDRLMPEQARACTIMGGLARRPSV